MAQKPKPRPPNHQRRRQLSRYQRLNTCSIHLSLSPPTKKHWLKPGTAATRPPQLPLISAIKGSELDLAFRRLKQEGLLPRCSRQQAHQTIASSDRPCADEDGSAALLELLIRHHGNDNETGERADLFPGCKNGSRL